MSTLSTRGERPPWTQRTAPPPLDAEPEDEEVAAVPGAWGLEGVLVGEAVGDEERAWASLVALVEL